MPEFHAEPYVYLPALSHRSALVAWGAFYFRSNTKGRFKLVDDHDLKYIHPPRKDSIGAQSAPYGPARVEVYDTAGGLAAAATTAGVRFSRSLKIHTERKIVIKTSIEVIKATREMPA